VANVIMAMPAAAEAGKLFDFNLTLPIMAGEILLLMVFLDKFWFGPVGKVSSRQLGLIYEGLRLKIGDAGVFQQQLDGEAWGDCGSRHGGSCTAGLC
jgi:hypothetical protein